MPSGESIKAVSIVHPLTYAPVKRRFDIREWLTAFYRLAIGMLLIATAQFVYYHPLWIHSWTFDRASRFDAIRNASLGCGGTTLWSWSWPVESTWCDAVDPINESLQCANYSRNRDEAWHVIGTKKFAPSWVRCGQGLWTFTAFDHAIAFVRLHAKHLDRGSRTRLAFSIIQENLAFDRKYSPSVITRADGNAIRLLKEFDANDATKKK